jgi:hypothetical protein
LDFSPSKPPRGRFPYLLKWRFSVSDNGWGNFISALALGLGGRGKALLGDMVPCPLIAFWEVSVFLEGLSKYWMEFLPDLQYLWISRPKVYDGYYSVTWYYCVIHLARNSRLSLAANYILSICWLIELKPNPATTQAPCRCLRRSCSPTGLFIPHSHGQTRQMKYTVMSSLSRFPWSLADNVN